MRPSLRVPDQLRTVTLETGVNRYAEGSCLITAGHTKVLVTATVETGVPVVVHVGPYDLTAARHDERVHALVAAALVSAEVVMAADPSTGGLLAAEWLDAAATNAGPVAGIDEDCGPALAAAVRRAARQRGGGAGGRSPLR